MFIAYCGLDTEKAYKSVVYYVSQPHGGCSMMGVWLVLARSLYSLDLASRLHQICKIPVAYERRRDFCYRRTIRGGRMSY